MNYRYCLPLLALLPFALYAQSPQNGEVPTATEQSTVQLDFLARLEGNWSMAGRGWPAKGVEPYRTASTMSANLRMDGRALVRDIEAPVIGLEALDVLTFHPDSKEYTYYYMSSVRPEPLLLKGKKGEGDEIVLRLVEGDRILSRTTISFTGPDEMVARDVMVEPDGSEWLSREVIHKRVP